MRNYVPLIVLTLLLILRFQFTPSSHVEEWHGYSELTSPHENEGSSKLEEGGIQENPFSFETAAWAVEFTKDAIMNWPEQVEPKDAPSIE